MKNLIQIIKKVFSKKSYGGYVPLEVIHGYIKKQSFTVVEAGAFDGSDTVAMAQKWTNAKIHAFEPVPNAFNKLVQKSKGFQNIFTYPMALSNATGTMPMHISDGPFGEQSSSLLEPKEHVTEHPDIKFNNVIQIPTITLDDWCAKENIEKIDFLWLDMQGFELAALKASPKTLANTQVIYTEVFKKELYSNAPLYPEVKSWMELQGFKAVIEELVWEDAGNVLFVRH